MSMENVQASTDLTLLDKDFLAEFRDWLELNLDGLTWQGRYQDEFEQLWEMFFVDGLSLEQMAERFVYASERVKIGLFRVGFIG